MAGPLDAIRVQFRTIATTIVPEATALDETGWLEVEAIVNRALSQRPPSMRRQLIVFVRIVSALPVALYGRTFLSLSPARRTRVLSAIERSPIPLLRRGLWGLRTLVFMGYYARPSVARELGYNADARGWAAR